MGLTGKGLPSGFGVAKGVVLITIIAFGGWFGYVHASADSFRKLTREGEHKALAKIITDQGAQAGWDFLKKTLIVSDGVLQTSADPHELAHDVGKAFYEQMGPDGLARCDDSFSTGCYHGFLEGLVTARGLHSADVLAQVCNRMSDNEGCVHGTGHAVYELEDDIHKALGDCDAFFKDKAFDCWEGAFMNSTFPLPLTEDTAQSAWNLCTSEPARYRAGCAGSLPLWMSNHGVKTKTMASVCGNGATKQMRDRCFYQLGAQITRTSDKDPKRIVERCATLGVAQENACLMMGASLGRTNRYLDWAKAIVYICSYVTGEDRERCG